MNIFRRPFLAFLASLAFMPSAHGAGRAVTKYYYGKRLISRPDDKKAPGVYSSILLKRTVDAAALRVTEQRLEPNLARNSMEESTVFIVHSRDKDYYEATDEKGGRKGRFKYGPHNDFDRWLFAYGSRSGGIEGLGFVRGDRIMNKKTVFDADNRPQYEFMEDAREIKESDYKRLYGQMLELKFPSRDGRSP